MTTATQTSTTLDQQPSPRPPQRQRGRPLKSATGNAEQATLMPTERAERAWRLRLAGWTWQAIAESLRYSSRSTAYQAASRYALLVNPPDEAARDALRAHAEPTRSTVQPHRARPGA